MESGIAALRAEGQAMQDKPIAITTESTARVGTKAPWASGSSMEDADRAVLRGLLEGESEPMVVLALNGERIETSRSLIRNVAAVTPGQSVRLTVLRDGRTQEVTLQVGRRPPGPG